MIDRLIYSFVQFLFMFIFIRSIEGRTQLCSSTENSSMCFCRSYVRRSTENDLFLSQVSLENCSLSPNDIRQCQKARFYSPTQSIIELIPNLINQTRCYDNKRCLYSIPKEQRCNQCQIIPPSMMNENVSTVISVTNVHLPTNSCFYLCEHDHSCGFLCFEQRVTMKVQCDRCQKRRPNVTCRCLRQKPIELCFSSTSHTTTERWMQKRGFPAAGILGLLVLATVLLIITGKSINRRLSMLARQKTNSLRRSIATITTYRSRQPSPSTILSFPNTPLMPTMNLRKETAIVTTSNDLLVPKPFDFVVDVQRRDEDDELSVYLLDKTSNNNQDLNDILDIDDDEDDDEGNRT